MKGCLICSKMIAHPDLERRDSGSQSAPAKYATGDAGRREFFRRDVISPLRAPRRAGASLCRYTVSSPLGHALFSAVIEIGTTGGNQSLFSCHEISQQEEQWWREQLADDEECVISRFEPAVLPLWWYRIAKWN
jgi:hypothetical protein